MTRALAGLVLAALLAACAAPAAATATPAATRRSVLGPQDTIYTLRHDNVLRTYVLHVPAGLEKRPALPVVVMLHGDGSTSEGAIVQTGWSAKADAEGFVVAYPQADKGIWNDGTSRGLAGRVPYGDVGFVGAVFDDVGRHVDADPRRLYVTGFSSGASLAWLVGLELGHRAAAVAPIGGYIWVSKYNVPRGVSLLHIAPGADPEYPAAGGRVTDAAGVATDVPPVSRIRDVWVNEMRCPFAPLPPAVNGIVTRRYAGCRDGTEAVMMDVAALGHVWPGGPSVVGLPASAGLDGNALIWDFFRAHPRTP